MCTQKLSLIMETRRKRKEVESQKTELHKLVTYVKGQIVFCKWKHVIWWPGFVEEVFGEDVYKISFWEEDEMITCNGKLNLREFQSNSNLIASSLKKLRSPRHLKEKYLQDLKQAKSIQNSNSLDTSPAKISVVDALKLIDADCVSEENYTTRSRVEEVFPEIVDSVEEVVSDDGSKNLSGYSEHSRNCSNTAKDKEKAERGEHGSLDTSPAEINVEDALKLIDADCVSEENNATQRFSRVEEVFPEIVDRVEEVVSDDGSKNLSGYSEHSRNCSNTAKDKEKAERGEHGSCLSRKKNTLECFLEDLKWAKESHDTSKCQVRVSRKRKKQKGCKEQCSRQKKKRRKFIKIQEVQGSGDVDCPHLQPKDHSCMEIQAGLGDVDYPQLQPDDHSCSECQEGLSDINYLQHQPNDYSCPEPQVGPGDVDYPQLQPTDHSCLELQVGPGDVNYPQLQPTDHRCQFQSDNHNCSEPELQAGPGGVDYPQLRPDDHSCSEPELQADPDEVDYPQLQPDDHSCLERQASLGDIDCPQLHPSDHSYQECQGGPGDVDYPKLHPTDHRCLELQAGPGGIDYPQLHPDDHSCLERHAGPGDVDYSEDCEDLDDLNYIVKTEDEETEDESDSESSILDDESSSSLMSEDKETEDEGDSESSILDDEGSRNDVVVESCPGDVYFLQLQPDDHSCPELQADPGDVDYPGDCEDLDDPDSIVETEYESDSDLSILDDESSSNLMTEDEETEDKSDSESSILDDEGSRNLMNDVVVESCPGDVYFLQLQPDDHSCPELQADPGDVDYPGDCEDLDDPDSIVETEDESDSESSILYDESSSNLMNDVVVESCPGDVGYPEHQLDDHSCPELQAGPSDVDYPQLQPTNHSCMELQAGPGDVDYHQLQPDDHSCLESKAGPGDVDNPQLQPTNHSCLELQAGPGDVDYPQLQPYDHSCPEPELRAGPSDVDNPQLQPDDHTCLESQVGLGDVEYPQLQPDDHSCSERQVGSGDIDYPEDCEDLDDPDFIVETEDEETKDESDRESSILDDKSSSNLMNDVVVESYQGDVGYPELQPVDHSCTELQAVPSDVDYPQLQPDDHNSSELQAGPGDVDYPQLQPDDHSCAELQAGAGDIDNPQLQPTDHSCLKLQAGPGDVDYPQLQPDDHSCAELQAGPGDIDNPQLQPTDHSFLELQAGPGEVDNPQLQPDDHSCPQGLASSDDVDYPEDCEDLNDPDYIVETEDESDSESSILDDESSSNLMNDVEVESCMGDVDYPQLQPDDHSCPELQAGPDDVDSPKPEDCEALDERDLDCDNPPCKRKLDEKDCLFDKKFPNVFIKGLKKDNAKSKHNRVYDCVHACLYCHELFTNIQSHLERRHVNHTKVKAIKELKDQKMKETNQEKIDKLEKRLNSEMKLLRNLGDHHHNMKVLRHKEGELLLPRRRLVTFNFEEYGPCPKCKEWMVLNSSISNHQKTCPVKSTDYHKGSTIIQIGILTGKVKTTGSKRIEKEVLPSMKRDKFAEICMNDPLILALGDVWFMKNIDNKRKRKNYSSFHMRLAARLLLAFRNLVKRMDVSMSEMLSPENFDNVAEVALQICNSTEHEEDELQHPSTAIKSGFDLMRMASSKVGISIKTKNKEMKKEGEAFMYLMSKEWGYKVNKVARSTLSERMFNQKKELPYPEDIMKLSSYLVENLEFVDLSYTAVSGMMFRRIVMLVEARLILYNRRRPGELEALSLQCYRNRSKEVSATDLSLREQLSKFEKEMLDNQELVEIRGKNGTRVQCTGYLSEGGYPCNELSCQ
ncbi:uncharacterized protein [Magallana gigas]|uniref:uncharacterized protein isoform X5 n=1 Tax=Magallana gigas TaxID=29159 RepID=UPI0033424415